MRCPALLRVPLLALIFCISLPAARAAGLPDTGEALCDNGSHALAACSSTNSDDSATYPRQDGRFGRDAAAGFGALTKIGGGAAGFDYSKIANNGTDLGAGGPLPLGSNPGDWACTRDNITGLTWEVKTATSTDLRYSGHTYTWYNSSGVNDGGNAGGVGTVVTCGMTVGAGLPCNTQNYVINVNLRRLCNYTDWRLPSLRELSTLMHFGVQNPSIDATYFPNTASSYYWSGTPYASNSALAWLGYFALGGIDASNKTGANYVRLVRGPQF